MVGMKSRRVIGQVQGLLARGALGHLPDALILEQFCLHRSDADLAFGNPGPAPWPLRSAHLPSLAR